jgi:hypothetical protein
MDGGPHFLQVTAKTGVSVSASDESLSVYTTSERAQNRMRFKLGMKQEPSRHGHSLQVHLIHLCADGEGLGGYSFDTFFRGSNTSERSFKSSG